jgi:dTMP kinase
MFIVVEGIDGSGKTTLVKAILDSQKISDLVVTQEPYQGEFSLLIRKLIKQENPYTSSLHHLFMTDRDFHIKDFIKPNLNNNKIVISDRYLQSTMVYQSNYIDMDKSYNLHIASEFLIPDLSIYIDGDVTKSLKRISGRKGSAPDCFEKKDFLTSALDKYRKTNDYLEDKGWNFLKLNGNDSIDSNLNTVIETIKKMQLRMRNI